MGKDVEGKGRQKALEREEQYEEVTLFPVSRIPTFRFAPTSSFNHPPSHPPLLSHPPTPIHAPTLPTFVLLTQARELLVSALDLLPPSVYRATLYRDLCICNTKTRRSEEARKVGG